MFAFDVAQVRAKNDMDQQSKTMKSLTTAL
jgi:hypothetical protein